MRLARAVQVAVLEQAPADFNVVVSGHGCTIPGFAPAGLGRYSGNVSTCLSKSVVYSIAALVLIVATTGCPRATRRTLVPSIPTHGDATARARFQEAKARFERDGGDSADFDAIAETYPDDPIAPYALLYAGIAAVKTRDYERAVQRLESLEDEPEAKDPGLFARGQLYLGIAQNYLGQHATALRHLDAGERAIEGKDERGEWLAAMAESLGHGDKPLDALPRYDQWYAMATEAERAYIVTRLRALIGEAPADTVRAAYEALAQKSTPAAAILGVRVAADWAAAGSPDNARRVRRETAEARKAIGLADGPAPGQAGDPGKVGAILPLSGRSARAGELAMRGLALASGTFPEARGSDMRPFDVSVRDSASTATGSASAVDQAADEGCIALVGPIDGKSVDDAAARAHARGVPLISLNPRASRRDKERSRFVFHVLKAAEDRAQALARHAHAAGVKSIAILRPDDGYGRAVAQAFRDEVVRLGARVATEVGYDPRATSFGDVIKKLGSGWDTLFIPEQAERLALITPALAAADLEVVAVAERGTERRGKPGRRIALLSTAEFIAPSYLRSAGRYSVGAVLAPGFYPDRDDPVIRDFVSRYELAFGSLPTALDAHAHDAALIIRQAVAEGAATRAELVDMILANQVTGLTGTITFGEDHRRSDDGLLFTVAQDGEEHSIRAMRN